MALLTVMTLSSFGGGVKCAINPEDERSEQREMQERFARQAYRGGHDKP